MNKTAKTKDNLKDFRGFENHSQTVSLRNSKRGVSPLVATVLLLVLAIGLGVIVMSWGRAQVEAAAKCSIDTELRIVELNNIPEICFGGGDNGVLHFILENGPNTDVDGLQLRVIGKKNILNLDVYEKIPLGHSLLQDIPFNFNQYGAIRQVKITPKVVLFPGEKAVLCPEQAIIIEDIGSC